MPGYTGTNCEIGNVVEYYFDYINLITETDYRYSDNRSILNKPIYIEILITEILMKKK